MSILVELFTILVLLALSYQYMLSIDQLQPSLQIFRRSSLLQNRFLYEGKYRLGYRLLPHDFPSAHALQFFESHISKLLLLRMSLQYPGGTGAAAYISSIKMRYGSRTSRIVSMG